MLKQFIDNVIVQYPEGLSRGLDNEIKAATFHDIAQLYNARSCRIHAARGIPLPLDHYHTFYNDEYVYYYSQPYCSITMFSEELFDIAGFEKVFTYNNSWYFPDRCSTILYRRPSKGYNIYLENGLNVILIEQETPFDAREMRMLHLKRIDNV